MNLRCRHRPRGCRTHRSAAAPTTVDRKSPQPTSAQDTSRADAAHRPEQPRTTPPDEPSPAKPRTPCTATTAQPTAADASRPATRTATPAAVPRPDSETTTSRTPVLITREEATPALDAQAGRRLEKTTARLRPAALRAPAQATRHSAAAPSAYRTPRSLAPHRTRRNPALTPACGASAGRTARPHP